MRVVLVGADRRGLARALAGRHDLARFDGDPRGVHDLVCAVREEVRP
jgi:hypothetical protein